MIAKLSAPNTPNTFEIVGHARNDGGVDYELVQTTFGRNTMTWSWRPDGFFWLLGKFGITEAEIVEACKKVTP